jgi:very-short-patch-repair endonuclease
MGFDLAARTDRETAVGRLDAAARARLLDLEQLATWLSDRHEDDVVAVRAACALADARAESPQETVCRLRLRGAGLEVVPQFVVVDGRGFVARVDLALVALRIAIEYEGRWHAGVPAQLHEDRLRLNRLQDAGWTVVYVTAELLREHGALADAVHRAAQLRRAAA